MRKSTAWLLMAAIAVALLGADFLLLTSTAALSRIARVELEKFGEALGVRDVHLTFDGELTLSGVEYFYVSPRQRYRPMAAERVVVRFAGGRPGGRPEHVTLHAPQVSLSDRLIEDLRGLSGGRPIREVLPPEMIPRVSCDGGTVEASFPDFVAVDVAQVLRIRELTLTPVTGYRCFVTGALESDIFGLWRASGVIDLETGAKRIQVSADGVGLDERTRRALSPQLQQLWDRYHPGGLCDLSVLLVQEAGKELDVRVTLLARDMSVRYVNFPYPVSHSTGEIEFGMDGFRIKHMIGRRGDAVMRFDGASGGYGAESPYTFRVEVENMRLDDVLRGALDPAGQRVWDSFAPGGRVDVKGRVIKEAGEEKPIRMPLDLSFRGATVRYQGFPYEVKNLTGEVTITESDVIVKGLTSRNGGATLAISGSVRDITSEAVVDLDVDAKDLPLDEHLRAALDERTRGTWDAYMPSGTVDGRWRVLKEKGKELSVTGRIRARGGTATWREIPLRVTGIEGEIGMEPGLVRLRHLTGTTHGGAVISVNGTVAPEGPSLQVDGVGLPLDEKVREALPKEVSELLKQLRLGGTAGFSLGLNFRKEGKKQVDLALRLSRGVIDTVPKFEEVEGSVMLTGFFEKEPTLMGFLTFPRATVWGKRLTDLSASFNVRGPKVNFVNIKATAYGGVVSSPAFAIDAKSGEFAASFSADRIDLREYALDTAGYAEKTLSGKATLDLPELSGRAGDAGTIKGRGKLTIKEGMLWDIPIFVSLFKLNPQDLFKQQNQFDAGYVDFEIGERKFKIPRLAFTSESVSVLGRGRINFDGDVHLVLKAQTERFFGLDFFLTKILTRTMDYLVNAFHGVEVTGPFEKPEVSQKFFPAFKE